MYIYLINNETKNAHNKLSTLLCQVYIYIYIQGVPTFLFFFLLIIIILLRTFDTITVFF